MFKITFCTTIRNRISQIKKTLPVNIRDNIAYPEVQFLLLDYNSSDGLSEWIFENLSQFINSNLLVYYQYPEAAYYHRSHSRNVAFKLAAGEIVCNIDADNFTGKRFAFFLDRIFNKNHNSFVSSCYYGKDFLGKIACKKSDFEKLKGYDETMVGYGFEDFDFINRLSLMGLKNVIIKSKSFHRAITHCDESRVAEEKNTLNIQEIYVCYITDYKSELLFFGIDGIYMRGIVIDVRNEFSSNYRFVLEKETSEYQFKLKGDKWKCGKWKFTQSGSYLLDANGDGVNAYYRGSAKILKLWSKKFYLISKPEVKASILQFYSEVGNRNKMIVNLREHILQPNSIYGVGEVIRKFNY